ncbi:MAG: AMP-binding protein [Burkholderiales bacterium]|nr:AMP-binding protein [Burkholderiales bacterium]
MHPSIHAQSTPDKPAWRMAGSGQTVSYRQLDEASNRLAHYFRSVGVGIGDRIALMLENHPRYFEICWAAQRAGIVYTAISSRLTAGEAAYIVNDCGAKVFISSMALAGQAAELLGQTPRVQTRLMLDGTIDGYQAYEAAVAGFPTERIADESAGGDMLYSSGTTGRPKGVFVPPESTDIAYVNSLLKVCIGPWQMGPETLYLSPGPLYHAAPLRFAMAVMRLGGTVVVMEHFDAAEFLALVEKHRITHTQVVPTMFVRMLKLPEAQRRAHDLSSLRIAIHAAAPCPVPVKEQMIAWWGPIIWEYYAGTEGMGMTLVNSADWLTHKGTVGRAVVGVLHICDDDGNELPPGQNGGVYFSDGKAFEYHNDPEKTAAARNARGWTTLGDIGTMDAEGYLYLTDRKAHMIISGGVNIYPQEAENLLVTHPKVLDVAVFGVPNEEFGEEVKAVVQPRDMAHAGKALEQELIAFCREHLSAIKCPRSIDFEAELPRHPTGKLYKRLLRDRYWKGHASKIV